MLADFEHKLIMAASGVELFSCEVLVGAALPRAHPPLHKEPVGIPVLSTLLECRALQLLCLFMVALKYWSPLFCFGPRDCGWKWLLLSLVLHPTDLKGERGEGGMMPLQQHRMGAAITPSVGNSGVAFLGDTWPSWVHQEVLMSLFKLLSSFQNPQSSPGKIFPAPTGSLQKECIN